jgi:3-hydroxy-3-methylglutaryl CoA synthase
VEADVSDGVAGITSYGVFVPRLRMPRAAIAEAHAWALPGLKGLGRGERAFCSWDEDAVTLGVQAARSCLSVAASSPAEVVLASTTAPFADLQNASIVCRALRLDASVTSQDVGGTTQAGLRALAQALEAGGAVPRLVVAADRRHAKPGSPQEFAYGAGAAAFMIGTGDVMARYLGRHSTATAFVDHFRERGERFDYYWEERWIRDAGVSRVVPQTVSALLTRIGIGPERVAAFGLAGAPPGSELLVAKALGFAPDRIVPDLQGSVGDTGAAHPLLLLASAIERGRPGDVVVIAGFGLGCEALAFEIAEGGRRPRHGVADAVASKGVETSYLKMLCFEGGLQLDFGPRSETTIKASLSQQFRSAEQLLGFVGGRCGGCGQVQFPALPACVNCGEATAMAPFGLADEPARLATVSADWLQFYPSPPLYVGLVQFDAGARVLMEIVDAPAGGVEVGTPLRFAFRLKAHDELRHYTRYFWKAVPAT